MVQAKSDQLVITKSPERAVTPTVFISYAREDQQFVQQLHGALAAKGLHAWVDWEGIPPTAEWMTEIRAAIDAADTFLFIISPESVASDVCK